MSKNDTKYKILKAAADIVQTDGILDLTLAAVAKKAGVSKGGLLYHFSSKNALIEGMIQHSLQSYTERIKKEAAHDSLKKGKWTRSFIKETFQQSTSNENMDAGLMAAAALNLGLLKPIQDAYREWQDYIEQDGLDPIHATILRLAMDGLWFSEIFGLAPLEDDRRKLVLERLIQLTQEN
ncbi:TetR/AcrR family transcriptional regulator [Virgibacillus dakarensis]|uniref:TetR/AcrR family transcriptional regulator n=1 Tax=Virgibacillus dakarensis TaxID=1917889 RepID=UPI000B439ABD|nr:TetR/AcrR family transcriptional regulator [Virgibacillus dakarensis]